MSSSLAISGLASGFDWQSLISQLVELERSPETQLEKKQNTIELQKNAFSSLNTELSVLQGKIDVLSSASFYDTRKATSSSSSLASATAESGTALGQYAFKVTQMATASVLRGASDIGASLSSTDDVSSLKLSDAGFSTAVTGGTFTVNGKQVAISTDDTLQSVFDKISTATGGVVTASYSASSDKITLSSTGEIVLGSATDTSSFLQAAKLHNTSTTGNVTSSGELGGVKASSVLNSANLSATITDGGSGAGEFKINGVSIQFNAAEDTLSDVLRQINDSSAGVVASYDSVNNRVTLTSKETGDMGVAVEDVTGNFLAATGLSSGAVLEHGKDLLYTVNGGSTLSSQSNTITADSSGITGLSINVLGEGNFSISVSADTDTIKSAVTAFVSAYNSVQSFIDTQTASSTDAKGKVSAGILAADQDTNGIASKLRSLVNSSVSGLPGTLQRLESLGFISNGTDDTLSTSDTTGLDEALTDNLTGLKELFTTENTGVCSRLGSYLDTLIGDDGWLQAHQSALTQQSKNIDGQIESIEKQVAAYEEQLTSKFQAMETAQAAINTQLQYLNSVFSKSNSS